MLTGIKIRKYTPDDKVSVVGIFMLNTPLYFSVEEKKELERYLINEIDEYFVVEHSNRIVASGGVNFSEDPLMMKLSWDIVHPDFQKMGIGTLLLKKRLERIQTLGQAKFVTVRTSQLAFQFYEKNGFRLIETSKDYWAKGFDLYKMELQFK